MRFLKTVFFLLCIFTAVNVHAQSSQELKKRRDQLTQQLQQLNQEYQETASNKKTTLKQLNILIPLLKDVYSVIKLLFAYYSRVY